MSTRSLMRWRVCEIADFLSCRKYPVGAGNILGKWGAGATLLCNLFDAMNHAHYLISLPESRRSWFDLSRLIGRRPFFQRYDPPIGAPKRLHTQIANFWQQRPQE
jgi:hypothetical protein